MPQGARTETPTVTARSLRGLAFHLASKGVNALDLAAEHGIAPEVVLDPNGRITHAQLVALWAAAEARLGDSDVGLHAGESADVRLMGLSQQPSDYVLLQLFATSRDVGQGLAKLAQYFPLVHGAATGEIRHRASYTEIALTLQGVSLAPHFTENIIASIARLLRFVTGDAAGASHIYFRHPAHGSTSERTRILAAPVTFGAGHDGFRVKTSQLGVLFTTRQATLHQVIERRAKQMLNAVESDDPLVRDLKAWITRELRSGAPSAERAAESWGVSVRTMGRRLQAHGTSHQRILDDVRRELASGYLVNETYTIAEVARLLGFAEASTFDRAFRRWSGRSPGDFRLAESSRLASGE